MCACVSQEIARAKEEAERARQERQAEKAAKAEATRVANVAKSRERQAVTGIKKHKRGPTTAGAALERVAWEPTAVMPSPELVPVAIAPMPEYVPPPRG